MGVKDEFSPETPEAIEEVLSHIKESELVFCLEEDGIRFYVAHTYFTNPRVPITVSIAVHKRSENESSALCTLQRGWVGEEEVRSEILKGKASQR